MGAFLSALVLEGDVAASTQSQALNALVFLYRKVFGWPLGDMAGIARSNRPRKLRRVMTPDEVVRVLGGLQGTAWLVGCLLYGSGLRLMEAVRLRVKDVDCCRRCLTVRDGKSSKDRQVTLSDELQVPLKRYLGVRRTTFERDIEAGCGTVYLPHALARKYPAASTDWNWQYQFATNRLSVDPRSGARRRHHIDEHHIQRRVRAAALQAELNKPVSCHTFRHPSAGAGHG